MITLTDIIVLSKIQHRMNDKFVKVVEVMIFQFVITFSCVYKFKGSHIFYKDLLLAKISLIF